MVSKIFPFFCADLIYFYSHMTGWDILYCSFCVGQCHGERIQAHLRDLSRSCFFNEIELLPKRYKQCSIMLLKICPLSKSVSKSIPGFVKRFLNSVYTVNWGDVGQQGDLLDKFSTSRFCLCMQRLS